MHDVFKKRHSVRNYKNIRIEKGKLDEILQAAHSAPSAGNLKAREIEIVTDQNIKRELARAAYNQNFAAQSPVVLVFFAVPLRSAIKYGERGKDLYALQDSTIAASFAWLQAVMLGLSACWVGAFNEKKVSEILNINKAWRPIAIMPIGYSDE